MFLRYLYEFRGKVDGIGTASVNKKNMERVIFVSSVICEVVLGFI